MKDERSSGPSQAYFNLLPLMSILLLACLTELEAQNPIQAPGRHGVNVDRSGAPLANVLVRLEDQNSPVRSVTRTDQQAAFHFEIEKASRFLVALEKEGFRSVARDLLPGTSRES